MGISNTCYVCITGGGCHGIAAISSQVRILYTKGLYIFCIPELIMIQYGFGHYPELL